MNLSNQITAIKATFEEFKVFVVKQAPLHPITAIALTILLPITIIVTCAWGIRRVIQLSQQTKPTPVNTQIKPVSSIKADISPINLDISPIKKPDVSSLTITPIPPSEGFWNKKYLCLGGLALGMVGVAVYCYSQVTLPPVPLNQSVQKASEAFLTLCQGQSSIAFNPFNSTINEMCCPSNILTAAKTEKVTQGVALVVDSFEKIVTTAKEVCPAMTMISSPFDYLFSSSNVVASVEVVRQSTIVPSSAGEIINNAILPGFCEAVKMNPTKLHYFTKLDMNSTLTTTVNNLKHGVKAISPVFNSISENVNLTSLPVCEIPVIETTAKFIKAGVFNFADKLRAGATSILALGLVGHKVIVPYFKPKPVPTANLLNIENEKKATPRKWTTVGLLSLGVVGGAVIGTIANLAYNQFSLFEKSSMICASIKDLPLFPLLNSLQQEVIKRPGIAEFYNCIPGAIVWASAYIQSTLAKDKGPAEVKKAEKLASRTRIDFVKTATISLIASTAKKALKSVGKGQFDPSGHIMFKLGGLHSLIVSARYINDPITWAVSGGFALFSIASDTLFLANTAGCFHTPLDIVAGTVYGLGAIILGGRIVDYGVNYYRNVKESVKR